MTRLLALVVLLLGCGGGLALPIPDGRPMDVHDGAPPPDAMPSPPQPRLDMRADSSGLDRGRRVASLSDADLGRLCDWGVALLGGYGTVMACTDGTQLRNSPGRQSCIQGHDRSSRCVSSVAQTEDCLLALASAGCSQALLRSPLCQPMLSCQGA